MVMGWRCEVRRRADHLHMLGVRICIAVHSDCLNLQLSTRSDHATGDLSPIGDEHLTERTRQRCQKKEEGGERSEKEKKAVRMRVRECAVRWTLVYPKAGVSVG